MPKKLYLAIALGSFLIVGGPSLVGRVQVSLIGHSLRSTGHSLGRQSRGGEVMIEFADYQCPACASTDSVLRPLLTATSHARVVYHHYPLETNHPYAFEAAVAAECAAAQGAFERMHHLMFSRQAALGRLSWTQFARDAGVNDTVSFQRCMDDPEAATRVEGDLRAATRLGLTGTPAFLIDGNIHYGIPSESLLAKLNR